MRGLILSGGGARGAYQSGVIKALAEIVAELKIANPFEIYTGVSAGAINAAFMASGAHDFSKAAVDLTALWTSLTSDQIFKTDAVSIGKIGLQWMSELSLGALGGTSPGRSLLDTSPLAHLIKDHVNFGQINNNVQNDYLRALAITALDYKTSETITFVQGHPDVPDWNRLKRHSEKTFLQPEHIMASSAIPVLFPPVQVGERFFGDGCVRNVTPCSPALHLGAKKIIAIGVRMQAESAYEKRLEKTNRAPSVSRVVNVLLNSVLLDGIDIDIERLKKMNELLARIPEEYQTSLNFKKVDYVFINPSEDIGEIAAGMSSRLPRVIRYVLKGLGPLEEASELISYLLFEKEFCNRLIEVGYKDGLNAKQQILDFFKD